MISAASGFPVCIHGMPRVNYRRGFLTGFAVTVSAAGLLFMVSRPVQSHNEANNPPHAKTAENGDRITEGERHQTAWECKNNCSEQQQNGGYEVLPDFVGKIKKIPCALDNCHDRGESGFDGADR